MFCQIIWPCLPWTGWCSQTCPSCWCFLLQTVLSNKGLMCRGMSGLILSYYRNNWFKNKGNQLGLWWFFGKSGSSFNLLIYLLAVATLHSLHLLCWRTHFIFSFLFITWCLIKIHHDTWWLHAVNCHDLFWCGILMVLMNCLETFSL